ncbi:MAG: YdiU family protein [Pseudomonadota bacterium]
MVFFQNTYAGLPDRFHARLDPAPVARPAWLAFNDDLATGLGLSDFRSDEGLEALAGNRVLPSSQPIAMAYAGQQFGNWSPQLGDGRALLLGEIEANGQLYDVQLKGSGPTPFSRMGDGRAWLGPVLREYLVSETMAALGVPTTRALAAVATGEPVVRETALPGAVLTRVARSHLRVGTFQYFAIREDREALEVLTAFAIERLWPEADGAAGLLDAVVGAQAELVARWMGLGFIHGVMNTDNVAISGETIDYGPCAFMDGFDVDRVFSSIDEGGRYAYGNQPKIAHWNLVQFAQALLPLMKVEDAQAIIDTFPRKFGEAQERVMLAKLGIDETQDGDMDLLNDLLRIMQADKLDFTNTFRALNEGHAPDAAWGKRWKTRIGRDAHAVMGNANPAIIPRNHRIVQAITAAVAGDLTPFETLHAALKTPFAPNPNFAKPPQPDERVAATFCGT